nr:TonB-dependent receptor [Bacteroidota bacterium]
MNRPETYRSYRPAQSNSNLRWGLNLAYRSTVSTSLYDVLKVNLYQQYKKDFRKWFTDSTLDTLQAEGFAWWRTYNTGLQAIKHLGGKSRLLYGTEYQLDVAESPGDEQFTMMTPSGEQAASPKTHWHNIGIYAQNEWDIITWLTLSAGIRYDYFHFTASNDVFYTKPGDPDTTINQAITDQANYNKAAITGSAAAVFHLSDKINLACTWAHGFRMFPPNFGFSQTGQGVLIPNGLLDPVTADMFEISPRIQTGFIDADVSLYYTRFNNFQQPIHGEYNGNEFIDFNNNGTFEPDERVYVNTPNGNAFVYGIEADLSFNIGLLWNRMNGFYLIGGAMYNYGRMQFPGEAEMPLRHTHPARGIVKLRFEHPSVKNQFWVELAGDFVVRFDQVDENRLMSDVGYLENPQDPNSGLYRDYGLPSYEVFHLRGGIRFNNSIYLTLAVENIFDLRYRTAHSRMDASGRNMLIGLELVMPEFSKH